MKNLNQYIKESILDDEEDLMANADITIQIMEWLKLNKNAYNIKNWKVNKDNTIDADSIQSLNCLDFDLPDFIQFNYVKEMKITGAYGLQSFKGFPKKCDKLILSNLQNGSFESFPKDAKYDMIVVNDFYNIKSLKGLPKSKYARIFSMPNLVSFEDLDTETLDIFSCQKIKTFKGIKSKNLNELLITHCPGLQSIEGLPKNKIKKVLTNFAVPEQFKSKLMGIVKKNCEWVG